MNPRSRDTAVSLRGHGSNGSVELVYRPTAECVWWWRGKLGWIICQDSGIFKHSKNKGLNNQFHHLYTRRRFCYVSEKMGLGSHCSRSRTDRPWYSLNPESEKSPDLLERVKSVFKDTLSNHGVNTVTEVTRKNTNGKNRKENQEEQRCLLILLLLLLPMARNKWLYLNHRK